MERNEAYGYNTGVPTSFDGDLSTINHIPTSYNNTLLGNTATSTPNPFFQPIYTTTFTNNPFFNANYNTTMPSYNTTDILPTNPFFSPNYNTTVPTDPFNSITNVATNPIFNPNYNTTIPSLPSLPTIPTNIPSYNNNNNTFSPNYNFQQFITNTTNTIGTFQGAPLTDYIDNYNYNNIGLAQNYENNTNMLVNSVQTQPQLNIGVQPHDLNVDLNQNQINQDEQLQISMGVNSADHLSSFVFSDGENSGSINGNLAKKRRNASRHKRSSFLPFHQFDYNQHVPAAQPARVCYSPTSLLNSLISYLFLPFVIII